MKNDMVFAGAEARHPKAVGAVARHPESADTAARHPKARKGDGAMKSGEEVALIDTRRPMLRNANINYSCGTFFVTIQAAFNKTIFGAIVGKSCVLNELGNAVDESLRSLGKRYPGTEVVEFIVMPNHVHVILHLARRPDNRKHQLGYVIGRFKGWISKVYRDMLAAGRAVDVGATPWQRDYWDKLVTTPEQLEGYRRYIRENPAKWTRDRFGAVTNYSFGNVALLNARLVAFVASQGACRSDLRPKLLWVRESALRMAGAEARHPDQIGEAGLCPRDKAPVISTFTSAQERAVFAKVMAHDRRFIKVYPGGIPPLGELEPAIAEACEAGRGLLISPSPSGTGLNKQRAVWCNEYILKNAAEVWAGEITPGHTLASLVAALKPPIIEKGQ